MSTVPIQSGLGQRSSVQEVCAEHVARSNDQRDWVHAICLDWYMNVLGSEMQDGIRREEQ